MEKQTTNNPSGGIENHDHTTNDGINDNNNNNNNNEIKECKNKQSSLSIIGNRIQTSSFDRNHKATVVVETTTVTDDDVVIMKKTAVEKEAAAVEGGTTTTIPPIPPIPIIVKSTLITTTNNNNHHHTATSTLMMGQQQQQHKQKQQRCYGLKPLQWDEIKNILYIQQDLSLLVRSIQQQQEYEEQLQRLKKEWCSITDYILCTKFSTLFTKKQKEQQQEQQSIVLPSLSLTTTEEEEIAQTSTTTTTTDDKNGTKVKYYAYPSVVEMIETNCTSLELNDFPYYFVPGIEHYILWKIGSSPCNDHDIMKAQNELQEQYNCQQQQQQQQHEEINNNNKNHLNQLEFLHWNNPIHLKSLPDIDHVHILTHRTK